MWGCQKPQGCLKSQGKLKPGRIRNNLKLSTKSRHRAILHHSFRKQSHQISHLLEWSRLQGWGQVWRGGRGGGEALWTRKVARKMKAGAWRSNWGSRWGSQRHADNSYLGNGKKQSIIDSNQETDTQFVSFPLTGRLKDLKWNRLSDIFLK